MHSRNRLPLVAALTVGLIALLGVYCSFDRDNPLDPGSDNYVGDNLASDDASPTLIVAAPSGDTATTDYDSVLIRGTVSDLQSGVSSVTVGSQSAIVDSIQVKPMGQGDSYDLYFWHATVYLTADTTVISIVARDSSLTGNPRTETKVIVRITTPNRPSGVSAQLQGGNVWVSWTDDSRNESGFVIQQRTNATSFAPIDTVGEDAVEFLDSATAFQPTTVYYYRVVAINASGESQPSQEAFVVYPAAGASDTAGPVIVFSSPTNGETVNATSVEVLLSVSDSSGVKDGSVKVNNVVAQRQGAVWRVLLTLAPDSVNELVAVAIDNSANANASERRITVTCDTTAEDTRGPIVTFVAPNDGDTVSSNLVNVSVTATDVSGVMWVRIDGVDLAAKAGGRFDFTNYLLEEGPNRLTVVAADVLGNLDSAWVSVVYSQTAVDNTPPALTIDAPQPNEVVETVDITVAGSATDNSGVASVSVNGTAATLTGTSWSTQVSLQHGSNTIGVTATDASPQANTADQDLAVIYNLSPTPQSKPDTSYNIGDDGYFTTVVADDPDGDTLYYELVYPGDAVLNIHNDSGFIEYYPVEEGAVGFAVKVTDSWGGVATLQWTVSVSNAQGNSAPYYVDKPADVTLTVGDAYEAAISAVDPDTDALTISLVSGPMSESDITGSNGAWVINWSPSSELAGSSHEVGVEVSDGHNLPVQYTWNIDVQRGNNPPVVQPAQDSATVQLGAQLTMNVVVVDPDGDAVSLDNIIVTPAASGVTCPIVSGDTYELKWTPTGAISGLYHLQIIFVDDYTERLHDTGDVWVTVEQTNNPPQFDPDANPPTMATVGTEYVAVIGVSDPDGDKLGLTRLNGPADITLALDDDYAGPARLVWNPGATGNSTIRIQVDDNSGGYDTLTWNVTVQPAGGQWSHNGLDSIGLFITDIAVDAQGLMLVGTKTDGLYFSEDNGVRVDKASSYPYPSVQSIACSVDGNNNYFHYVATQNNGGTATITVSVTQLLYWDTLFSGPRHPVPDMVSRFGSDECFAIVGYDSDQAVRTTRTNNFQLWADGLPSGTSTPRAIAYEWSADRLYIALTDGVIYFRGLTDGKWIEQGETRDSVTALEVAQTSGRLFAGTIGAGLKVSADDGKTWSTVTSVLPTDLTVRDVHYDATNDRLFVCFVGDRGAGSTFVSADGGGSWAPVAQPPSTNHGVFGSGPDGVVWLGTTEGKVYRYMAP